MSASVRSRYSASPARASPCSRPRPCPPTLPASGSAVDDGEPVGLCAPRDLCGAVGRPIVDDDDAPAPRVVLGQKRRQRQRQRRGLVPWPVRARTPPATGRAPAADLVVVARAKIPGARGMHEHAEPAGAARPRRPRSAPCSHVSSRSSHRACVATRRSDSRARADAPRFRDDPRSDVGPTAAATRCHPSSLQSGRSGVDQISRVSPATRCDLRRARSPRDAPQLSQTTAAACCSFWPGRAGSFGVWPDLRFRPLIVSRYFAIASASVWNDALMSDGALLGQPGEVRLRHSRLSDAEPLAAERLPELRRSPGEVEAALGDVGRGRALPLPEEPLPD